MSKTNIFILFITLICIQDCRAFEPVRTDVAKHFRKVRNAIENRDFSSAIKRIERIESRKKLNAIESAYIASFRGNIEFNQGNMDLAIESYKKLLQLEPHLPLMFSNKVRYVVAQIEFTQKRYSESIIHAEKWLCRENDPTYNGFMLLAQSYYLTEDYESARIYVTRGMEKHAIKNEEPKSGWVNLTYKIYKNLRVESAREVARSVLMGIYPNANIDFGEDIECGQVEPNTEVNTEAKDQFLCELENAQKARASILTNY